MEIVDNIGNSATLDERTRTRRVSKDGTRMVVIERWLDRQVSPPRRRSKNYTIKLTPGEIRYFQERDESS